MTLAMSDIKLSLFSSLEKKIITSVFGNVIVSSLLITLMMLFIFHLNSDNVFSSIFYGFIISLGYTLASASLIRKEYSKNNSMDSDFSSMMNSVNTGPVITGSNDDDFAALAHILN
jgi:xanthine/uracil permease